MIYAFLVYLYFTLESMKGILDTGLGIYLGVTILVFIISIMYYSIELSVYTHRSNEWKKATGEEHLTFIKFLKHSVMNRMFFPKMYVFLLIISQMFPSHTTMKWVAGTYVTAESISYLQSNEAARQLPSNVLEAANSFLKDFNGADLVKESVESVKNSAVDITSDITESVAPLKDDLINEVKELSKEQKQALIDKLTN